METILINIFIIVGFIFTVAITGWLSFYICALLHHFGLNLVKRNGFILRASKIDKYLTVEERSNISMLFLKYKDIKCLDLKINKEKIIIFVLLIILLIFLVYFYLFQI